MMEKLRIPLWMPILNMIDKNNQPYNGNNGVPESMCRLSGKFGITYSHLTNLINIFLEKGLITKEKKGRNNTIKLTKAGKLLLESKISEVIHNDMVEHHKQV